MTATPAPAAEEHVEQLTLLTSRLTDLLVAEAKAFEALRPGDLALNTGETARLANLYRHEAARVRANPGLVSPASQGARRKLIAATEAFEAVLARHGRALKAAKTVTEGLVRAIATEVAATRNGCAPYGPGARAPIADASAITLNRRA